MRLTKAQDAIANKKRVAFLGTSTEVLVEKQNFKNPELLKGRTRCWKNVLFPGDLSLIGTIQTIDIHSYSNNTLLGERRGKKIPMVESM